MMVLKLLLITCMTLIAPAVAIEVVKDTDFSFFNTTEQDEIIVPKIYNVNFQKKKSWIVLQTNVSIEFEILKPIYYLALYSNGLEILNDTVTLNSISKKKSILRNTIHKPTLKYYKKKDIHIMEFPLLKIDKYYILNVVYRNRIPSLFEIGTNQEYQLEDNSSCLLRLLDSSSSFDTISLTSPYSTHDATINISIDNFSDGQLFANNMTLNIVQSKTLTFTLPPMSIYKAMVLMGRNFEETKHNHVIFWHSPKVKNEIQHAVHVSHEVWLQMQHFAPKFSKDKQWLSKPTRSVISPQDVYPTVSNLGLIVYRQNDVTYNKSENYFAKKAAIEMVVSYEVTRQTLRNIVYPSSWIFKCLQESLAVYMYYILLDKIATYSQQLPEELREESMMSQLYVVQILQPSMHNDVVFRLKPFINYTDSTDEFNKSFLSRLYYDKGSTVIYMLENVINRTEMQRFISKYIEENTFTLATDFLKVLPQVFKSKSLSARMYYEHYMYSWLSCSSYPEIYVWTNFSTEVLTINLQQYPFEDRKCVDQNCNFINCSWSIFTDVGVSIRYNINRMPLIWKSKEEFSLYTSEYDFTILSWGQASNYRINYDDANWAKIVLFLNYQDYTKIPILNRVQLIDDSYHFVMNGKLNWLTFLQLINYLKHETSYIAWYPMINIMTYMRHFFHYPASNAIKPILADIFGGLLKKIGYIEHEFEDDMTKAQRMLGSWWACKLGHFECRENALKKLTLHLENPRENPIHLWREKWVYCAGMMAGNAKMFINVARKYFVQQDEQLLKFMACDENIMNFINLCHIIKANNTALIGNISKLKYNHVSHFVKQYSEDWTKDLIINSLKDIIPGVLSNAQFWADIILNIYQAENLFKVKKKIMNIIEDSGIKKTVESLIIRQFQRINKLYSTPFYI